MSAAGDTSSHERRAIDRLEILGDLRGEVMVFQAMVIREISPTGAQIESNFPLQLDSLHDVRLSLGDHFVVVKARVAHCRLSDVDPELVNYRSGLEFVEVSEAVRSVVRRFIETIRAGRKGP